MKINAVRVHRLSVPLPRPVRTSIHNHTRADTVLVEHMDWWQELFTEPLGLEDGHVRVPDRPGIGLDLSPKALERFKP